MPSRRQIASSIAAAFLAAGFAFAPLPSRAAASGQDLDNLPTTVQHDVLSLQLDKARAAGNHHKVLSIIAQLRKDGVTDRPELDFYEAKALFALGDRNTARAAVMRYLNATGRKGKDYQAALQLFVAIEGSRKKAAQHAGDTARQKDAASPAAPSPSSPASPSGTPPKPDGVMAEWNSLRARVDKWKHDLRTVGGAGDDIGWALTRTRDGGFLFAGSYQQLPNPAEGHVAARLPWVLAFDAEGRLLWTRVPAPPSNDGAFHSIQGLPNGDVLYGGLHRGTLFAMKTDAKGLPIPAAPGVPWVLPYGKPSSSDDIGLVRHLPDGTVLAFGSAPAKGKEKGLPVPYIERISAQGHVLGKTFYGGTEPEQWHHISNAVVLGNGDTVMVGETRPSRNAAAGMAFVLRVAADGKKLWTRRIMPQNGPRARLTAVTAAKDGGVLAVGRDGDRLLVVGLDRNGNSWTGNEKPGGQGAPDVVSPACRRSVADYLRALSAAAPDGKPAPSKTDVERVHSHACGTGHPFTRAVAVRPRGDGYLVLSVMGGTDGVDADIRLTGLNASGRVAWNRDYGSDGEDLPGDALATADGGFIIAGTTSSVGDGGADLMLFKVNRTGAPAPWRNLGPPSETKPMAAAAPSQAAPESRPSTTATPKTGSPSDGAPKPAVKTAADKASAPQAAPPKASPSAPTEAEAADHNWSSGGSDDEGGKPPEIDLIKILGRLFSPKANPQPHGGRP